jgi:hypothetical protein
MTDQSEQHDNQAEQGDQEVDPELMDLARERSRQSALRPILFIAVIAVGVWVISDFWPDVRYYFSSTEPIAIGDVTDMAGKREEDPNWKPDLPHNRLVELGGIPKRRSQSRLYRYFKLVGAPIYVEVPRDRSSDPLERKMNEDAKGEVDRTYFGDSGQLIAFAQMTERYQGLKSYYQRQYGTRFCEMIDPKERERIEQERRQTVITNWKKQYEAASEQERKEKGLTPEPTDEEIAGILNSSPICVHAYLLRAEREPGDNWWYVLLAGLFGAFMLVNLYWLVGWGRNYFSDEVDLSVLEEDE